MTYTLSVTKGSGNPKHNERTQPNFPPNADSSRTPLNITLEQSDIKKLYRDTFKTALEQYNEKQRKAGHPGRQIADYYSKVSQDKRQSTFYELVIQIGNQDDQPDIEQTNAAFKSFLAAFKERNSQMLVVGAYIHNDEQTPHMHLDYVPIANGAKKGPQLHVNNDLAIKQMGFQSWTNWRACQFETMARIMDALGMEREIVNSDHRHLSVQQYKAAAELYEREKALNAAKFRPIQRKAAAFNKSMVVVPAKDLDALEAMAPALETRAQLLAEEQAAFKDERKKALNAIREKDHAATEKLKKADAWEREADTQRARSDAIQAKYNDLYNEYGRIFELYNDMENELETTRENLETALDRIKELRIENGNLSVKLDNLKAAFVKVLHAIGWILERAINPNSPFYGYMPEPVKYAVKAVRSVAHAAIKKAFPNEPDKDMQRAELSREVQQEIQRIKQAEQAEKKRQEREKEQQRKYQQEQKQRAQRAQNERQDKEKAAKEAAGKEEKTIPWYLRDEEEMER